MSDDVNMNPEIDLAWKIIANTDTHLFLTGKAGTGKTTFLRKLRTNVPKRMIVVAPTGIAAINAEGVTIHSFFQLPFGPQVPGTQYSGNKRYAFRRQKLRLIRSVDLIVIDEISMVRADLLDAIDSVLRQYRDRSRPFGGVQMLLIGDMQQLAPVAREDEWSILRQYYDTPYFFSSKALQQTDFVTVELQHVYRQSDPYFLEILNKVRNDSADENTLQSLNQRFIPNFNPAKEEGYIRLVTHNNQADSINQRELDALTTPSFHYDAKKDGDFPELSFPTEEHLTLKRGAQVMFVKNDSSASKRYYNGMIGEVVDLSDKVIKVKPSNGEVVIEVHPEEWTNVKYEIDEKTRDITEVVVGKFVQYPLKTAWAITVHKSQGLTFERAIIDVQHSFAHGQTYVALSRCKTLEGMVLASPIPRYAIINDRTVEAFCQDPRHQSPDEKRLEQMERQYLLRTVTDLFSFMHLRYGFNDLERLLREHFYSLYPKQYNDWKAMSLKFKQRVEDVAIRFHNQYQNIIMTDPDYLNSSILQERLKKGAAYFETQLCDSHELLRTTHMPIDNQTIADRLEVILQTFSDGLTIKLSLMHHVANEGLHLQDYLKYKAKVSLDNESSDGQKTEKEKGSGANLSDAPAGFRKREKKEKKVRMVVEIPTEVLHKELFTEITQWRRAEAEKLGRPAFFVMTQKSLMGVTNLLPSNNAELESIPGIGNKFMENYSQTILHIVAETVSKYGYDKPEKKMVEARTMKQEEKERRALEMYQSGMQVEEIALEFMVTESTVYHYLQPSVLSGALPLNHLFEQKKIDVVNKCLIENPNASPKGIKDILGSEYNYGIINCCRALLAKK